MPHHISWRWIAILFIGLVVSGCLKDLQKTPSDLSQIREGYFKNEAYHNDVYRFSWSVPGWKAVTPGLSFGQRFIFGWDHPSGTIFSRLWSYGYDPSVLYPLVPKAPAGASLDEAADWVASRQGWTFVDAQEALFNGKSALKATYVRGTEEKGIVYFWLEWDAVLLANAFGPTTDFERSLGEMRNVLHRLVFSDVQEAAPEHVTPESAVAAIEPVVEELQEDPAPVLFAHTIRYPGETLALIAQWYTGSSVNWNRILEVNDNLSPHALRLGQTVSIPMELVIKSDPMPESVVRSAAQPVTREKEKKDAGEEQSRLKPDLPEDDKDPSELIMAPPR